MTLRVDGHRVATHVINPMAPMGVVIVHHVAEPSVKIVEATIVGPMRFGESKVPFADERGVVSSLLELRGDGGDAEAQFTPTVFRVGTNNPRHTD